MRNALAVLLILSAPAVLAEEQPRCDQALFDPITVGLDGVDAREAFELVVHSAGLELDMAPETDGTVTLAAEFVLALEVLDDMAAELGLEWTQEGCRVIVTAPAEQPIPGAGGNGRD